MPHLLIEPLLLTLLPCTKACQSCTGIILRSYTEEPRLRALFERANELSATPPPMSCTPYALAEALLLEVEARLLPVFESEKDW